MSITIFHPTNSIGGTVYLPSSKSLSNRSLIIRELCDDFFEIKNLSEANDTLILKNQLASFFDHRWIVNDEVSDNYPHHFNVGDAGTAMRFFNSLFTIKKMEVIH